VNARIDHWTPKISTLEGRQTQMEQVIVRVDAMAHLIIKLTSQVSALEEELLKVQTAQVAQVAQAAPPPAVAHVQQVEQGTAWPQVAQVAQPHVTRVSGINTNCSRDFNGTR
jgi:uncharacterized coiled-coil protein SlyX